MTTDRTDLPDPLRQNFVWRSIRTILCNLFAFWLNYRTRGIERLPRQGGALLLVNHQSFLDPLLVGLPLERPVSFLARDNLFRVPVIGWILRKTYVMPIRREAASTDSLRESLRRMEHGFYVGIFPEGTRGHEGRLNPLKSGIISLIRRANVPVIPVAIAGSHKVLPRGGIFPRPCRVRVEFGDPLPANQLRELCERGREKELLAFAEDHLRQLVEKAERWRSEE